MRNTSLNRFGICLLAAITALALFSAPAAAAPLRQESDPRAQAEALFKEGRTLSESGQFEDAIQKYEAALLLFQEADDRKGEAFTLLALGDAREQLGDHTGALHAYESSLPILRDVGLSVLEWTTLSDIGFLYYNLGQYEQALEVFQRALDAAQSLDDWESELATLELVGMVYGSLGQYEQALQAYLQALAIAAEMHSASDMEALFIDVGLLSYAYAEYELALESFERALAFAGESQDRLGEGWIFSHIGMVYAELGQFEQALGFFQQSLDVAEEVADQALKIAALTNRGTVYSELKRYEQALETFEQAAAAAGTDNQQMKGALLGDIGTTLTDMGRCQQALDYLQRALTIAVDTHDANSVAIRLSNIGGAYAECEEYEQALETYERALSAAHEINDQAGKGFTLLSMATVYEDLGQDDRALELYLQGIDAIEAIQGGLRVERFRESYAGQQIPYYEAVITLLSNQGAFQQAFGYAERARARAFLDQLGNQQIDVRRGAEPELINQERDLCQQIIGLQNALSAERAKPIGQQSQTLLDKLTADLEQARKDYQELLTRLKLASPEYASLVSVSTLTLPEVQSQVLDEATTLIEYFVLDEYTLAWVVDCESFQLVKLAISRADLRNKVEFLRNLIAGRDFDPQAAAGLYEALFAPLVPHVRHANLMIVPHGVLHYLPFAALWDAGRQRYLVQDYALAYAPSASALKFILAKRNPDAGRLLALGNPDGTLPDAESEAKAVAALYAATPLLGQQATESQVRARAGGLDLLHLAAHGVYNPYNPLFSRIELAAGDGQDGHLEVHEVYGLNLTGANLVVLSACNTALGAQSEGDELVGLTRAFLYAGAPAVVTTLWSIEDAASGALMAAFYRHLREGLTTAEALRAAQLAVLEQEKWRTPYYWAAFGLTGDYRGNGQPGALPQPTAEPLVAAATQTPASAPPTEAPATPAATGRRGICGAAVLPVGLVVLAVMRGRRVVSAAGRRVWITKSRRAAKHTKHEAHKT